MSAGTSSDASQPKPDDRITVEVAGESRTVFMSYGLLGELSKLVGGVEMIPSLSFDAALGGAALELMLASRDKRGKITNTEDASVVPFDFPVEQAESLINWAGAHLLDFFVRQYALNARMLAAKATPLADVASYLTSSRN